MQNVAADTWGHFAFDTQPRRLGWGWSRNSSRWLECGRKSERAFLGWDCEIGGAAWGGEAALSGSLEAACPFLLGSAANKARWLQRRAFPGCPSYPKDQCGSGDLCSAGASGVRVVAGPLQRKDRWGRGLGWWLEQKVNRARSQSWLPLGEWLLPGVRSEVSIVGGWGAAGTAGGGGSRSPCQGDQSKGLGRGGSWPWLPQLHESAWGAAAVGAQA